MIVSISRNLYVYLQTTNQLHLSRIPSDIAKILQNCYFRYFGHAWLCTPKVIHSTCRKLLRLSAGEKSTSFPSFFRRYCKDMQTFYFGYFEHAWLPKLKMIVSPCRKLQCLSACHKYISSFISSWDITFKRILQFDWPAAFWPITRGPESCQIWNWLWNISKNMSFHFR